MVGRLTGYIFNILLSTCLRLIFKTSMLPKLFYIIIFKFSFGILIERFYRYLLFIIHNKTLLGKSKYYV